MPPLTEIKLRSLKPREKIYRVADSHGLCVEIQPSGAKYWRYRYRHAGKPKMISLGVYPETSLLEARRRHVEQRQKVVGGADPSLARKFERLISKTATDDTFEAVFHEWLEKQEDLSEATVDKAKAQMKAWVLPWLGKRPCSEITEVEILSTVSRIEARGRIETAQRMMQRIGQIMRYAVVTQRAKYDPTANLKGAIRTVKVRHHAAITDPLEIGHLLLAIDGYSGHLAVASALRLAPLVFLRPGELRKAEWSEFDLENAEWEIPAERMKMKRPHLVPLSRQALEILQDLQPLTGNSKYVFPSVWTNSKTISENTITAALRRLGYTRDEMTGHGFRSTASTRLHEMGWNSDIIERQLAHVEQNRVKAAYNRAEHITERRRMMQEWADSLDALRNQAQEETANGRSRAKPGTVATRERAQPKSEKSRASR